MNELEGCADLDPDHCPFCGSDEVDPDGWKDGQGRTGPSCDNCGATAESVEEWNHRPTEDRLRAENERLRARVEELNVPEVFPEITTVEQAVSAAFDEGFMSLAGGRILAQEVVDLSTEVRILRKVASPVAVKICERCSSKGVCTGVDWDCADLLLALAAQEGSRDGIHSRKAK